MASMSSIVNSMPASRAKARLWRILLVLPAVAAAVVVVVVVVVVAVGVPVVVIGNDVGNDARGRSY